MVSGGRQQTVTRLGFFSRGSGVPALRLLLLDGLPVTPADMQRTREAQPGRPEGGLCGH